MRYGNQEFSSGSNAALSESRTVNLLTSDSTTVKQAKIDEVPRNAASPDVEVTFRFEDGTHSESDTINFKGFTYPINIIGNPADTSLSTSKSVHLDFTGAGATGLNVENCSAEVKVFYFKITVDNVSSISCVNIRGCNFSQVYSSYFVRVAKSAGNYGISVWAGVCYTFRNYLDNVNYAIIALYSASINSDTNDDTGTVPTYGLAAFGSVIMKEGTQPSGTTANESSSRGGVVR